MDATQLSKGQSLELNGDGRPVNLPGIYVHKDTGAKFITAEGNDGVIQADSLMSPVWGGAWERKGDVPTRLELQELREAQVIRDARSDQKAKAEREARIKAAVDGEFEQEEKAAKVEKTPEKDLPEGGEYFEPTVKASKK